MGHINDNPTTPYVPELGCWVLDSHTLEGSQSYVRCSGIPPVPDYLWNWHPLFLSHAAEVHCNLLEWASALVTVQHDLSVCTPLEKLVNMRLMPLSLSQSLMTTCIVHYATVTRQSRECLVHSAINCNARISRRFRIKARRNLNLPKRLLTADWLHQRGH